MDERKILRRLGGRSVGLTTRELARSLKVRPSEVNQRLLKLQREGIVTFRFNKWSSVQARADMGSNISAAPTVPAKSQLQSPAGDHVIEQPRGRSRQRDRGEVQSPAAGASSSRVDRGRSRWSTFRRLCDYYAECVRLDQRSSITATAADEFETIVCMDGALPNSSQLRIRTRESWHKWIRKVAEDDYVFVGYPLQRYQWRDTKNGEDVDWV